MTRKLYCRLSGPFLPVGTLSDRLTATFPLIPTHAFVPGTWSHTSRLTMPAFSFSAPLVTPEEEQVERETLSEEEKKSFHDEVYGSEKAVEVEETEELLENAFRVLREALESIPTSEKRSYLEALERILGLVERECNPVAIYAVRSSTLGPPHSGWYCTGKLKGSSFGRIELGCQ